MLLLLLPFASFFFPLKDSIIRIIEERSYCPGRVRAPALDSALAFIPVPCSQVHIEIEVAV